MHDAGRCGLVKQRGLVFVQLAEDRPHECLADETAFILHTILRAEPIQHLLLAVIKENGYSMFARGFHRRLEIERKFSTEVEDVSSAKTGERNSFHRLNNRYPSLLVMGKENQAER